MYVGIHGQGVDASVGVRGRKGIGFERKVTNVMAVRKEYIQARKDAEREGNKREETKGRWGGDSGNKISGASCGQLPNTEDPRPFRYLWK